MPPTSRAIAALLLAFAVPAVAQAQSDALPASLSGRWTYLAPGGRAMIDTWTLRVDSGGAPGSFKGTLNWRGVNCGAKDEPVSGTWTGSELRFEGQLRANANTLNANGNCGNGRAEWVLTRRAGSTAFEGEASMNDRAVVVTVTASP
jgi:hypothetical protein